MKSLIEAAIINLTHIIQVSTDCVFNASSGTLFLEDSLLGPVNVHGKSKLAGEDILRLEILQSSACVRAAWVYSSNGNNFVKTKFLLMKEHGEVFVVADQIGFPKRAAALWRAAVLKSVGTMHWTGGGVASWYDFAITIK